MQELRSTDILDKEIQADARKKAERMLQKADAECANLLESVGQDIEKAADIKKEFFNKKLEAFENDKKASVPLEKQRFKVSFIQNAISQNINKYLTSLSEEKRLELVSHDYDFKTELNLNASVYGFSADAAKKFLSKKLGDKLLSCKETNFGAVAIEETFGLDKPQGIILESEDKTFRCRLTLSEVVEKLMDSNRAELSAALFGGNL